MQYMTAGSRDQKGKIAYSGIRAFLQTGGSGHWILQGTGSPRPIQIQAGGHTSARISRGENDRACHYIKDHGLRGSAYF